MKLKLILLLCSSVFFASNIQAETPNSQGERTQFWSHGAIANCYQFLEFDPFAGTRNLLNLNGSIDFRFTDFGSPPHFSLTTEVVRIQVLDGGIFKDITDLGLGLTLEDDDFEWIYDFEFEGATFPVIEVDGPDNDPNIPFINPNTFTLGSYTQVKFTYFNDQGGKDGENTFDLINTAEEAFQMNPTGSCYTFTPFSFDMSSILDGLCSPSITATLSVPPGSSGASYLPPNFSQITTLNSDGSGSNSFNIPNSTWCDQCIGAFAPYTLPDPVPCGCMDMTMTITIEPCNTAPSNCPDLELELDLEVCCSCDVRESPPND